MESEPLVSKPVTPPRPSVAHSIDPLRYLLKVGQSEFFESHLKTEYSVENIRFWRAVEDYRLWYEPLNETKEESSSSESSSTSSSSTESSSSGPTLSEMEKEAHIIYDTYIAPKALQSVNISGELRLEVKKSMETKITPNMFDDAQNAIYDLMKSDAFPRFKNKTSEMVEASWKRMLAKQSLEELGIKFYQYLFATYPKLKPLFDTDAGMKGRMGKMVVGVMDNTINFLEKLDQVIPTLQAIGVRHANYGVELEYFTYLGNSLMWLFETEEGPEQWNDTLESAWANLYQLIAGVMAESMMSVKYAKKHRPRRSIHFKFSPIKKSSSDTIVTVKTEQKHTPDVVKHESGKKRGCCRSCNIL